MATQNFGPLRAVRASIDMSGAGYRYRAVAINSSGLLARAGAGERAIGILTDAPKSGEAGSVQVAEGATWEAGAAFSAGAQLTPDSTGRAVTATAGQYVLAIAREAADGAGHIVAAELRTATAVIPAKAYPTLDIADGSAEATYYVIMPFAGTITKLTTVTNGAVSTADITITANIGATPITNGVVTIATAGSAAGDVDTATPTAANVVTAGQAVNFVVTGGGAGGAPRIHLTIELTPA